MLTFLAALLAGGAQVSMANVQPSSPQSVFEATCLDGSARLSSGMVTEVGFNGLPSDLRTSLGQPASGKVWRLNDSGRSYLYILEYGNAPGVSPKVCGLASDAMDLQMATDMLGTRVAGGLEAGGGRSAQWVNVRDGYVATATTAAQFKVLQISWFSDADRATAQAQVDQLPH
jgi:hypothetical protein